MKSYYVKSYYDVYNLPLWKVNISEMSKIFWFIIDGLYSLTVHLLKDQSVNKSPAREEKAEIIAFNTMRTSHIVWYYPHLSQLNITNITTLFHSILLNSPQLLLFTLLYSVLCRRLIFYHTPLINFITRFSKIICKLCLI